MLRGLKVTGLIAATRLSVLVPLLVGALGVADRAAAQQPSDDQKAAIKANCRSDFMSYCFSVPRGGVEAFQCLKKNIASLSPGCQQAVNAITPPAPPPAAAKAAPPPAPPASAAPPPTAPATPATSAPAPAATPPEREAATALTPAPTAPAATAAPESVTTAPAPAPAKPAATTPTAPLPAAKSAATPLLPPPTPPVAPATPPPVRVVRPVQVLMLVRNSCRAEYRAYCSDVDIGGGRVVQCLEADTALLSPGCQSALADLGR